MIKVNNLFKFEVIKTKGIKVYLKMSPNEDWFSFYLSKEEIDRMCKEFHSSFSSTPRFA